MFKPLKQDPDAKTIYFIWFARENSFAEPQPPDFKPVLDWDYMVYFDYNDYVEDLVYIKESYVDYKVRIYKGINHD